MNCHFIYDKEIGKILISGCWGTVHSNDISDCYCNSKEGFKSNEERFIYLEEELKKLKAVIRKGLN